MNTILVVDDEASFLASIAEGLSSGDKPCRVVTATDGERAIALLTENPVALVMTDLKMPNVDGFELLAWLATNRPSTPVVVMTAFGTPTMEDNVLDHGALHFIEKPFDVAAARNTISRILESRDSVVTIALPDLLRLVMLERRSAVVRLGFQGGEGMVAVHDGQIVGARLGIFEDGAAAAAMRVASVQWFALDLQPSARADELRVSIGLGATPTALRLKQFLADPNEARSVTPPPEQQAIDGMLARALKLDGAVAASLVDLSRAAALASQSLTGGLDIAKAANDSAAMIRTNQRVLEGLGIAEPIEDFVVTETSHYHIIRVLRSHPEVALYVVLKRDAASLAFARMEIAAIDEVAA